jgi:hypothetical protein
MIKFNIFEIFEYISNKTNDVKFKIDSKWINFNLDGVRVYKM